MERYKVINVPEVLHTNIKISAAKLGISIRELVETSIRAQVLNWKAFYDLRRLASIEEKSVTEMLVDLVSTWEEAGKDPECKLAQFRPWKVFKSRVPEPEEGEDWMETSKRQQEIVRQVRKEPEVKKLSKEERTKMILMGPEPADLPVEQEP